MKKFDEKRKRQLFTAAISAIGYGAWAFYINHGTESLYSATVVQTVSSFIAGYSVAAIVEKVFWKAQPPWRLPLASLLPFSCVLVIFALVHALVGTEQILLTILPNSVIGFVYFHLYCLGLERVAKGQKVALSGKI